jgi:hypothetical protein
MSKRIFLFHRIAAVFFLFSLGFCVITGSFLKSRIPIEIVGYLVFLSLGLYVGFQVCLGEIKRMINRKELHLVAQELNVPSGNAQVVSNTILQQQSQELDLNYSANWLWSNYSGQFITAQGNKSIIMGYIDAYNAYRKQ